MAARLAIVKVDLLPDWRRGRRRPKAWMLMMSSLRQWHQYDILGLASMRQVYQSLGLALYRLHQV
jgi:hypothetical protein